MFKHQKTKRIIRLELAILICLCISQFFGNSALNLFFTVCIGLLMLSADDLDDSVLLLFTALPMFNLFNANIGSTSMFYLFIFIFWYKYCKQHNWKISQTKVLILILFFVIRLTAGNIVAQLKWIVLFSVLVLTYKEACLNQQLGKLVKYLTISFLIASLAGLLMLLEGRSIYAQGYLVNQGVTVTRFAGLIGDSVFYSQVCALLVGANLTLGCYNRRYLLPSLLMSAALTGFCLLSYAKTGLLLIVVELAVYVLWMITQFAKQRTTVIYSVLGAFAAVAAVVYFIEYLGSNDTNEVISNYIIRFSSDDLLTGRVKIWGHYLELLGESWRTLVCAMPDAQYRSGVYISTTNKITVAHNIYIETVCAFGLAATIGIFLWLGNLIRKFFKDGKGILNLAPIAVILGSGITLHGHFEYHYYFIVSVAVAFLSNYQFEQMRGE